MVRLRAAAPDCSGVGHLQVVYEVVASARPGLRRASTSCPLFAGECPSYLRGQPGALYAAALEPQRRPARTVSCVRLPATEATVTCVIPVDSIEAGRALLARYRRR